MKLEGKVAIVTGAGQGLGKRIAMAFAKEEAKIAIAELNPKTCEEAARNGYGCGVSRDGVESLSQN